MKLLDTIKQKVRDAVDAKRAALIEKQQEEYRSPEHTMWCTWGGCKTDVIRKDWGEDGSILCWTHKKQVELIASAVVKKLKEKE